VLASLDFNVTFPTGWTFLSKYVKTLEEDSFTQDYAQFILECGLLNLNVQAYSPSVQASSAIYLTLKVRMRNNKISSSNYNDSIE
jgi:hypothetical protein